VLSLKKLVKRDPTTKLKALAELNSFFEDKSRADEDIAAAIPMWQQGFASASSDNDRRVREQACVVMRCLVSRGGDVIKKQIGKGIKVRSFACCIQRKHLRRSESFSGGIASLALRSEPDTQRGSGPLSISNLPPLTLSVSARTLSFPCSAFASTPTRACVLQLELPLPNFSPRQRFGRPIFTAVKR
jgi:hypothetical protein